MLPFTYREKSANRHLRSYVKAYWRYRRNFGPGLRQTIFPDLYYEIMWVASGTLLIDDTPAPRLFVGGLHPKPITISSPGQVEVWSIRLYPWGFLLFDANPPVRSGFQAAEEILGAKTAQELTELFVRTSRKQFFQDADTALLEKLLAKRLDHTALAAATARLVATRGSVRPQDLADHCMVSKRQMERIISKATGHTPQEIAQRIRFEHVRNALNQTPRPTLTQLAHDYGFTDQSHLNKEFRRYTNLTPLQYLQEFRQMYDHLYDSQS